MFMEIDIDLKEFFSKIIIWVLIVIVFGSLGTIIFANRFGAEDISINKKINSKQTLMILVIKTDTKNKAQIENESKKKNFKDESVYSDKERYYEDFLIKLSLTEKDVIEPTIIYVEEKQAKYSLVDIQNIEELRDFLDEINQHIENKE